MKRIFLSLMLLVGATMMSAQSYNSEQEQLRREIKVFLDKMGYAPENQSDGLKFKSGGINYYVEIDKDETAPMYLRLCRYVKYDDKMTREKIMAKINDCNSTYAVKVSCKDRSFILSSELFVTKSSEFTDVFDTLLGLIKSAYESVKTKVS